MTAIFDATGAVQERYRYEAYGKTVIVSPAFAAAPSSVFGWETTFSGYRLDGTTALYYVRFRMYHPELGAWLTRDPAQYLSTLDLYEYPNAMGLTDPLGLGFWSSFASGLVQGLVVGAVVAVGAVALVTVGVPAALVTGTLFVVGGVSAGVAVASVVSNPSADNIGFTLGSFTGGAIVGGLTGRSLSQILSPADNQPAPGAKGWSVLRDLSQCWRWNTKESLSTQASKMMSTGPNPLSGASGVTAIGGGIPSAVHNIGQ